MNSDTYDYDFDETSKDKKFILPQNVLGALANTLCATEKMATDCDADFAPMPMVTDGDDNGPLRLGGVGDMLVNGSIGQCEDLVGTLFPGYDVNRGAANDALAMLRKCVGKGGVADYDRIQADLYRHLSDKGCTLPEIVTPIFMELLETAMTAEDLRVSIGYIEALTLVSVKYNQWESFLHGCELTLLAVCGAGSHCPSEVWTRTWVCDVLGRQLALLDTETERKDTKAMIADGAQKVYERMQLYPADVFKRDLRLGKIRPYQCPRPLEVRAPGGQTE